MFYGAFGDYLTTTQARMGETKLRRRKRVKEEKRTVNDCSFIGAPGDHSKDMRFKITCPNLDVVERLIYPL